MKPHPLWNVPNLLSLSRLPLTAVLGVAVEFRAWGVGLAAFAVAAVTDWADGWWARRYGPLTDVGRNLDPLTDKVLLGGAFIFLVPVAESNVSAWLAVAVIARELLVTGLRGIVEATGQKFGADWFGKLKTVTQFAAIIGELLLLILRDRGDGDTALTLELAQRGLLAVMLAATVGSGLQYLVKAARILGKTP